MAASADCVQAIQGALEAKGVQGRKTSTAALHAIERGRALIQEARRREKAMEAAGAGEGTALSVEQVQAVTELYRDAIELLSSATDEKKQVSGGVDGVIMGNDGDD